MEEPSKEEEGAERARCTENDLEDEKVVSLEGMNRREKRKAIKKLKRKQMRKEMAAREHEEEEARLNDPEEKRRLMLLEQEEAERVETERKLFEERERAWIEAMEKKMKHDAEEEQRKLLEETHKQQQDKENAFNQDDEWEYVEEGPAEIIWQGNEIIFRKKKVRITKKDSGHQIKKEDTDRPTSNPLPPKSEVFADHTNSSVVSAKQVLESVAQQVPNFGTEQDKAHCPFHLKTGACRFGLRCSRVHFYPDKSCTLLMKNMYSGPGLAWDQDEGLEYTDEEVERCFEEFYEDVHTEFLKFGEIVNFKVCKNGSFHLRGNVYVQYKSMDSALLAYKSINGRYFAGKQVRIEFVTLTRWKVAICGEYMKSGFKTCSHGSACNFIHCFRNPGGDYEWADSDKPPPRYWLKKMAALFGCSDDHEKLTERESLGVLKNSSKKQKTDADRYHSRRSRSRSRNMGGFGSSGSDRRKREEGKRIRSADKEMYEQNIILKDNHKRKGRTSDTVSDREWLDKEGDMGKCHKRIGKSSINRNEGDERRSHEEGSDVDLDAVPGYRIKQHSREGRNLRQRNGDNDEAGPRNWSDRDKDSKRRLERKSSRHSRRDYEYVTSDTEPDSLFDRDGDKETQHGCSRKSSKHRGRSGFQDDCSDSENESEVAEDWSMGERQAHHHDSSLKHLKKLEYS